MGLLLAPVPMEVQEDAGFQTQDAKSGPRHSPSRCLDPFPASRKSGLLVPSLPSFKNPIKRGQLRAALPRRGGRGAAA